MKKILLAMVVILSACESANTSNVTDGPAVNTDGPIARIDGSVVPVDAALPVPQDSAPVVSDASVVGDSASVGDGPVAGGEDACGHHSGRCPANISVHHGKGCGFASWGFINSHLRKIAKLSCKTDHGVLRAGKREGRNPDWCVFSWQKTAVGEVDVAIECGDDGNVYGCSIRFSVGK